ncbi:MAG TPA: MOSC N-terminal beta barrel domain-containing protein [Gaiellaceae bacterium]|nr:MOSC N-terminal beta barrel domain-containing protein [Gaiellaceae bacterium]
MATVVRISIAPVKGLGLVERDEVLLEQAGVRENRRFHIVDADGRRYNQLRNGALVQIEQDCDGERLAFRFPDGTVAEGEVALGDEITTDFYGRPVGGHLLDGPWSAALSDWAGRPLRLVQAAPGAAVDRARGPVSLVSRASLEELGRHSGRNGAVDGRRFRMLFEVDGCEPHEEDTWVKGRLRIGDAVAYVRHDVGRCAITTQNPDTGAPDLDTLRTIREYRGETANENGKRHIPFGVYGEVVEPGRVAVGDTVERA